MLKHMRCTSGVVRSFFNCTTLTSAHLVVTSRQQRALTEHAQCNVKVLGIYISTHIQIENDCLLITSSQQTNATVKNASRGEGVVVLLQVKVSTSERWKIALMGNNCAFLLLYVRSKSCTTQMNDISLSKDFSLNWKCIEFILLRSNNKKTLTNERNGYFSILLLIVSECRACHLK